MALRRKEGKEKKKTKKVKSKSAKTVNSAGCSNRSQKTRSTHYKRKRNVDKPKDFSPMWRCIYGTNHPMTRTGFEESISSDNIVASI
jgi:hypothetical protein